MCYKRVCAVIAVGIPTNDKRGVEAFQVIFIHIKACYRLIDLVPASISINFESCLATKNPASIEHQTQMPLNNSFC